MQPAPERVQPPRELRALWQAGARESAAGAREGDGEGERDLRRTQTRLRRLGAQPDQPLPNPPHPLLASPLWRRTHTQSERARARASERARERPGLLPRQGCCLNGARVPSHTNSSGGRGLWLGRLA